MNPGRELDVLIAEKVFGKKIVPLSQVGRTEFFWKTNDHSLVMVPPYSTHIKAAWDVVDAVIARLGDLHIEYLKEEGWAVSSCKVKDGWEKWTRTKSAPHAICLAALEAVK